MSSALVFAHGFKTLEKLWLYCGTIWLNGMIWLWNEVTRVTVEPPCVTTSQVSTIHKRPLNIQKIKLFLVNGLTVGTPSKQLALVMVQGLYGTTFWGWKFYNFPLFLTSCKQPLDVWSERYSYVCCMYCAASLTTWNYTYCIISLRNCMQLRWNPPGNWVIVIFSGQKPCTRII